MREIWYIHGMNASKEVFNYLASKLPRHTQNFFEYGMEEELPTVYHNLWEVLPHDRQISLIGHSLGGILATLIGNKSKNEYELKHVNIDKIITIASPFSGMKHVNILRRVFRNCKIIHNFSSDSILMKKANNITPLIPTMSIITTKGVPGLFGENDGTITCESMRAINNENKIDLHFGHTEVMISDELVSHTRKFIWGR